MKYFSPLERFSGEEIRIFRAEAGMTRAELAKYLGVTAKAVEAWEYGNSTPSGPVCRLMSLVTSSELLPCMPALKARSCQEMPVPVFPFEVLSPGEIHFLHGKSFTDPGYRITVTWKDCKDMLYLDFNYLGTKYHIPAGYRFRESTDSFDLLCREASLIVDQFILKKDWLETSGRQHDHEKDG